MFIVALLVIVLSWKVRQDPISQLKCPSMVEQINEQKYNTIQQQQKTSKQYNLKTNKGLEAISPKKRYR